jgi:hypothetical protein
MIKQSRPRTILAAATAAAAIAFVAGCSPPHSVASSPTALSVPHTQSLTATPTTPTATTLVTPTATPTTPTPNRTSPSPSPAQTGTVCVTSQQKGHCPFSPYAAITGASTDPYVDQNVWGPIPGWKQTLHATDPGHWYVTANMSAGNTAVVSFPNTGLYYNKALSGFSSIVSSFIDSIPATAGTDAEASYDIWLNNWNNEVMIQNDYSPGRGPSCGTWTATNVQFGGSNGVPVHPWDLCVSDSTAYWETANGNMPSGTVDVLAMLNWLVSHGQLPARSQLGGFSYGFEISSTGGVNENFQVSRFTAAAA